MSITSAFKGKNDYEVHFIGLGNITRWNDLKHKLQCINNVLFISKLLDIALEYYYNHYSKEPIDIYKINTIDNDDIDNITLDPSPRSSKIVDEKPEPKTIVTHDDTSVNSNVKLCAYCDFDHSLLNCPLVAATNSYHVPDNVQLDEWSSSASAVRYSYASAPHCLKVRNCDANINNEEELGTVGVFCVARNGIAEYVALGPLVGRQVAAATIAIDCDMRHMHTMYKNDKRRRDTVEDEMREDKKKTERTAVETIHISSDSDMDSNWVRHVRPVGTRAERNVTTVQTGERLYLVTVRKLQFGEELRYWDDTHDVIATLTAISNGNSGKFWLACGGCGLRFTHTLHYRQHCLLHHDTGRSLAMRKYHCLVCGVAVVGKERMRRHAQQAHQGRGAYQCQYCGKYFLRRNYLDMHRRYGCGRNPQRAKPLCDLCGKEFCQPQKQADHTIITTPTDRYMRFLDNPSLSLAPPRLDTNQYSPTTIDCTNQQHLLDTPIEPTRGDSTTNMDLLPLDTTKAKLDLSMYYDTALEEIRTRLAAYEAAAVANDMGKGMAGMYGVEQDAVGASGFLLDGVGEFRSFEPFVLQGGQSSPQGAGTSNADLQGLDMTSTGCRTNNITTQQYPSLSTTTITNNPSPCSSPGLTSYHHRFPPPPLHLNLDHHLQPPPRLYSPTLIDSTSSAAAAAAVVVADLSLRHHVAAAAAHHHVHAHAHSHHDGVFSTSAYSHSPPPNAGGVPSLGYPPPPQAPSGVYHPHYPQYY